MDAPDPAIIDRPLAALPARRQREPRWLSLLCITAMLAILIHAMCTYAPPRVASLNFEEMK